MKIIILTSKTCDSLEIKEEMHEGYACSDKRCPTKCGTNV